MLPATFSIVPEPDRDLVRVWLSGFFSVDDVLRFQSKLAEAHASLNCGRRGGPLTINDVSGMAIQSQEVVGRWSEFLRNPAHRSRRLAFVVASTLARMQLLRVVGNRNVGVFTDPAEAERWLFTDEASAAA